METERYDFAIIGSGFGGSIMSMVLKRLGYAVLLLERGAHPRFVIGESSTPFANLLLEHLSEIYELPFLRALSEWGSWQAQFPHIPAGLKRGFTFYHHTPGKPVDFQDRTGQLLVAASPNDHVADTHWYRPAFDEFLVQEAQKVGVHYLDHAAIAALEQSSDGWKFLVRTPNRSISMEADFLIDASGPAGFLAQHLGLGASKFASMSPTSAVYAHFRNVLRLDLQHPDLPYAPDDAAVHHVFPGGWIWVLRFNNGITSAGAALQGHFAEEPCSLWQRLLKQFPTLHQIFRDAEPITPFYHSPQLSFRRSEVAGANWALLPSTAGFVDPLLSTGFALTLLGIVRLGEIFKAKGGSFSQYQRLTLSELDASADLVSALYAKMNSFEEFALLSLLYFAAMTYTEKAWRGGQRDLGFFLTNETRFSSARATLCAKARSGGVISRADIESAVDRYNVAGLTDWTRQNWYPVT